MKQRKRILVTGVSGNVGSACAELFLANNWEIVGCARSIRTGWNSDHSVDLSKPDEVSEFIVPQSPFDLVVMTHGTQHGIEIGDLDYMKWYQDVMNNNLHSAVCLTNALIEHGQLYREALIVYCSSIHATQPRASRSPYAIAKAGLEALARSVAIEQSGMGIRAVALRLGQLAEPMKGVIFTKEQEDAIKKLTPLKWVSPAEVATLCLALYGQKSMTGATLDLNSGHSINAWIGL